MTCLDPPMLTWGQNCDLHLMITCNIIPVGKEQRVFNEAFQNITCVRLAFFQVKSQIFSFR